MKLSRVVARARKLSRPFRVTNGRRFRLADVDPADTLDFDGKDKSRAAEELAEQVDALSQLQERLYAQDRWAVLTVLQAMDAAGKDSAIKHVMSGVNPQGCEVFSFKAPSSEELNHDYLWRCVRSLPERGRIGIFNRSYYEEVLIVRVHQELLDRQKLPASVRGKDLFRERFEDIRNFERHLTRNGTAICKFFLHVSKEEQKKRFLARLEEPDKQWKFSAVDMRERKHWSQYMRAYEDAVRSTATGYAPWYVVPADHKWFTRLVVSSAIIDTMTSLDLRYPQQTPGARRELAQARKDLMKGRV
jgi:PPK2 family polyphosphate:nucleotide phosphotransferase